MDKVISEVITSLSIGKGRGMMAKLDNELTKAKSDGKKMKVKPKEIGNTRL